MADLRNSGGLHVGADGALERLAGVLHVVGGYEGVTRQHLAAVHLPRALSLLTHRLQCGERMLQGILPLVRLAVVAFGHARNLAARVTERGRVGVSVGVVLANQHVAHVNAASQTAGGTCADDAQAVRGVADRLGDGARRVHQTDLGANQQQRNLVLAHLQVARVEYCGALGEGGLQLLGNLQEGCELLVHSHLNNDGVGHAVHQLKHAVERLSRVESVRVKVHRVEGGCESIRDLCAHYAIT